MSKVDRQSYPALSFAHTQILELRTMVTLAQEQLVWQMLGEG